MNKPGLLLAIGAPKGAPVDGGAPNDTQGMGEPDGPDDMASGEDCVSLASLAMPESENGDQMANPEVGDKVSYTIDGTVTRVDGDNAYIKREAINGQPVDDSDDQGGADDGAAAGQADDRERSDLQQQAGQMGGLS